MKIYALLTGRGNNSLPNKNILPVLGRPLLSYPAIAASKVVDNDNLFVSSDDPAILDAAAKIGYKKIKRPIELAMPDSKHIDAIYHALNYWKETENVVPDILVVLLANSATVKPEWIKSGIEQIINDDSISSVVPAFLDQDHHPYRAKALDENGNLVPYFDFEDKEISSNRQDLADNYFLCHNFWVLNVKKSIIPNNGFKPWTFLGNKVKPILAEGCFDVHSREDLIRTETWLKNNDWDWDWD